MIGLLVRQDSAEADDSGLDRGAILLRRSRIVNGRGYTAPEPRPGVPVAAGEDRRWV